MTASPVSPSLRVALASPDSKGPYVRRLFATIADRYDLVTVLLSWGRDRAWKRRLVRLAEVRPGQAALDLACGTGDIAYAIARQGAAVVGLDITVRMIDLARAKPRTGQVRFLIGDMMALPFPDQTFDLVTAGYGIRNVASIGPAVAEIYRVLRPGGRVLSLDFNRPVNPVVRGAYLAYLTVVGSALGLILHGDPDTYRYIPESIRRYPGAGGVARLMQAAGFAGARYDRVLGGLMAINSASRE